MDDDVCLRLPPQWLNGVQSIKFRNNNRILKRKYNWEEREITVLQTLEIHDLHETLLFEADLEDIEILDNSKHTPSSIIVKLQNGLDFNGFTSFYIAFKKDEFEKWVNGLQYAKKYWIKKQSILEAITGIQKRDDTFLMTVTLHNGVQAEVPAYPSIKVLDLVKVVNKSAGCFCKICFVDKEKAQLFAVNREGEITLVKDGEEVYSYYASECKLFLMSKDKKFRLLVVFFEEEDGETSFVACTAPIKLTGDAICKNTNKLPLIREKMRSFAPNHEEVTLYYTNPSKVLPLELPLDLEKRVMDLFYDKYGTLTNTSGILLMKKNSQLVRARSLSAEEETKMKLSKQEAFRRVNSKKMDKIEEELSKYNFNFYGSSPTPSENSVSVEDFMPHGIAFEDVPRFYKPEAIKEFDCSSTESSTSIEGYTIANDQHDEVNASNEECTVMGSFVNVDDVEESGGVMGPAFGTSSPEKELELPSMKINSLCHDMNASEETVPELEASSEVTKIGFPRDQTGSSSDKNDSSCDKTDSLCEKNDSSDYEALDTTQVIMDEYQKYVLESVEVETTVSASQQPSIVEPVSTVGYETSVTSSTTLVANNTDTSNVDHGKTTPRPRKNKKIKCSICSEFVINTPTMVKSVHMLKALQPTDFLYICLSGIHLRKAGHHWSLADNCTVKAGFDDTQWVTSRNVNGAVAVNLGSFICLFVPTGGRAKGDWLVRTVDEPNNDVVKEQNLLKQPKEVPADVPEDSVVKIDGRINSADSEIHNSLSSSDEMIHTYNFSSSPQKPPTTPQPKRQPSFTEAKEKLKGTILSGIKHVPDIIKKGETLIENMLVDDKLLVEDNQSILNDEFVLVQEKYVKPLKDIIFTICTQMEDVNLDKQRELGDDFVNREMGLTIRQEICTLLAGMLWIGVKEQQGVLKMFFGQQKPVSHWDLVKEFALAFQLYEFNSVVKSIIDARLGTDDERFRAFFCQLLNRSKQDGTDKLIITFFQLFPFMTNKLEKFYTTTSFWRMSYSSGYAIIMDEFIRALKHLNGWPFNLHLDYEQRFCSRDRPAAHRNEREEDSLVFFE